MCTVKGNTLADLEAQYANRGVYDLEWDPGEGVKVTHGILDDADAIDELVEDLKKDLPGCAIELDFEFRAAEMNLSEFGEYLAGQWPSYVTYSLSTDEYGKEQLKFVVSGKHAEVTESIFKLAETHLRPHTPERIQVVDEDGNALSGLPGLPNGGPAIEPQPE
jgi:hypothetical protein